MLTALATITEGRQTSLRLASSQTMKGSFPPSSSTTGVRVCEAACMTFLPISVEPTKMSLLTPAVTSALPASAYPVTICTKCSGAPASLSRLLEAADCNHHKAAVQTDRWPGGLSDGQMDEPAGGQTDRQTHSRQAGRRMDRQAGRQTDRWTDIQTDRQTERERDRQTDRMQVCWQPNR